MSESLPPEKNARDRAFGIACWTLGALAFVLEVALTPERKLARENPEVVRRNLAANGDAAAVAAYPDDLLPRSEALEIEMIRSEMAGL